MFLLLWQAQLYATRYTFPLEKVGAPTVWGLSNDPRPLIMIGKRWYSFFIQFPNFVNLRLSVQNFFKGSHTFGTPWKAKIRGLWCWARVLDSCEQPQRWFVKLICAIQHYLVGRISGECWQRRIYYLSLSFPRMWLELSRDQDSQTMMYKTSLCLRLLSIDLFDYFCTGVSVKYHNARSCLNPYFSSFFILFS